MRELCYIVKDFDDIKDELRSVLSRLGSFSISDGLIPL